MGLEDDPLLGVDGVRRGADMLREERKGLRSDAEEEEAVLPSVAMRDDVL